MDLFDAEILAKSLISQHNPGVAFEWSRTKGAFGDYIWRPKMIRLSRIITAISPEDEVRSTIMHEIAHSLCPDGHGHGRLWRAQMVSFGLSPTVSRDTKADLDNLPGNWYGKCPNGHVHGYWYRKPRKLDRSCTECYPEYNPKFKLTWYKIS